MDERMIRNWVGLDVGGANIKLADGQGWGRKVPFELWREPDRLREVVQSLLGGVEAKHLALTMTGELADCFETKAEGVQAIVDAVCQAAPQSQVWVYAVGGDWLAPEQVQHEPLRCAAANWHALASYAGRFIPEGPALLFDVGSTTCDVIPLMDGRPVARGATDPERLVEGELVYTGVRRTPACAVLSIVSWRGKPCTMAAELFATTLDAYLVLDAFSEDSHDTNTADGRPATKLAARDRLARMVCADRTMFSDYDAIRMAKAISDAQRSQLTVAVRRVLAQLPAPPNGIVIAGQGEFLARAVLERLGIKSNVVALSRQLEDGISEVAPAHALAVLAAEHPPQGSA
jgi:probable H4MPT-linked C1 transfer pathway protein